MEKKIKESVKKEIKNKKIIILIIIGIIIILLDQISKFIIIEKNITIIPSFLSFTYTENTGAAFNIGSNNLLFIILVNIIILGIIIKFIKERKEDVNFKILISLVLILAGGIGNLIDRIFRGYVVDFIDVNLFKFPNFNIADISIFIGIFLLIIMLIISVIEDEKQKNKNTK